MQVITIRLAAPEECSIVSQCVNDAYLKYVERIGKKPAPMLADYRHLINSGLVHVMLVSSIIQGVLVMEPKDGFLFIENIAVHPLCQGQGLGKRLMAHAENLADNCGLKEIRLYTNELMTENIGFYESLGFKETDRRLDSGFRRVFMQKTLTPLP